MTPNKYIHLLSYFFIYTLGFLSSCFLMGTPQLEESLGVEERFESSMNPPSVAVLPTAKFPDLLIRRSSELGGNRLDDVSRKFGGEGPPAISKVSCSTECAHRLLTDLYDSSIEVNFFDIEKFTTFTDDVAAMLQIDHVRFDEFESNLTAVVMNPDERLSAKKELLLSIASLMPEKKRSDLAWTMALSHQSPDVNSIAFNLSPDNGELKKHIATTSMQTILSHGTSQVSVDSFRVLRHIVDYGGDLSSTQLENDLSYLAREGGSQFIQEASLSLLTQMAPSSNIARGVLWDRLEAAPEQAVSALNVIANAQHNGNSNWALDDAETQRLHAFANNPEAPIEVRIASLHALMAISDSTE